VDYRKLNAITIKYFYPIPRIDNMFDRLAGNSWFSFLDLKNDYCHVKIHPEGKEKIAFSIRRKKHCGNLLMSFGLHNAPATFEQLMLEVLQQLLHKVCLVYLDDVIIFSEDFEGILEC